MWFKNWNIRLAISMPHAALKPSQCHTALKGFHCFIPDTKTMPTEDTASPDGSSTNRDK
jgi:hypothetical protein